MRAPSDTELLELALSGMALEDDFWRSPDRTSWLDPTYGSTNAVLETIGAHLEDIPAHRLRAPGCSELGTGQRVG